LLKAGVALKLNQIKRATRSYARDRGAHAKSTIASYAIGTGLYVAAGVFGIAACFIGVFGLFRWLEITQGQLIAFVVTGGAFLVLTAFCALLAANAFHPSASTFPSLTSRLRVAIKANPVDRGQIGAVRDTAAAMLMTPSAFKPARHSHAAGQDNAKPAAALLLAAFLGWALARKIDPRRRDR
jgi:hypothetical protein